MAKKRTLEYPHAIGYAESFEGTDCEELAKRVADLERRVVLLEEYNDFYHGQDYE